MILPWVEKVEHLGHILHQSMSTDYDARRAAARFMWRASDIRDEIHFAHPSQKMEAINLNCCDGYGSMIWDLSSEATKSYFKAWNKQARLCWRVDYRTHTYLVEDVLCDSLTCLRVQIYSRYPGVCAKATEFALSGSKIPDKSCKK